MTHSHIATTPKLQYGCTTQQQYGLDSTVSNDTPVMRTTIPSTSARAKFSTVACKAYATKHSPQPIHSKMEKKSVICARNFSHSDFVLGGVSMLRP